MAWVPWFIRRRRDRDRQEEFDAHLAHHVEDLVGRGVSPDDARRQARLLLGNPRARREEIDEMQRLPVLDMVTRDLTSAVRLLRRAPGFTITALATLAVVIGANTAVFSLANGLLFTPLPYPQSDRLHLLQTDVISPRGQFSGTAQDGFTWEAIADTSLAPHATVFTNWTTEVNLAIDGQAMLVDQQRVSAGFFRVLGVAPRIGREFTVDEDRPGGPAVAVVSHALWQDLFGGREDVLGHTVLLRGESWQIVGVMPEGFLSTADADVWTPLRPSTSGEGAGTNYTILVRLPDGVTPAAAAAELRPTLDASLDHRGLSDDTTATLSLLSLRSQLISGMQEVIVMLWAAAGVVLLIACANLAALLLARGSARAKEIATRMALGSGRAAVVRQLMVESLVLALAGGLLGAVLGYAGLQGLQALAGELFAEWQRVSIDGRVLLMCGGLSVLTSVLFGLVPALQASRLDFNTALVEGGSRSIAGGARHWTRRGLIVAEVALGVVLLVGAGLLVRTFVNLQSIDPGFRSDGLVTSSVSLLDARYPGPAEANQLFERVLTHLASTPGVDQSTVSLGLPYERLLNIGFRFVGAESGTTTSATYVSPSFFDTFGIALIRGRALSASDTATSRPSIVVNDAFARYYSKDEEVLGRTLQLSGVEWEIVGVVADVQQRPGFFVTGMVQGPIVSSPTVYMPAAQMPQGIAAAHLWFSPVFTVKATSVAVGEQALRAAVSSADPLLPAGAVRGMRNVRADATAMEEMLMTLVAAFALTALLLTAIGLHGVIGHAVVERTREFGIRMALGATPGQTVRAVVAGGVMLAAVGAVLGVAIALPATSLVSAWLYGVAERDGLTYGAAAAFLLAVAIVASLLPALRLLRLDPAETLRR
jgi:predicted permease